MTREISDLERKFREMDIAPDGFFPTFKAGYEFAKKDAISNPFDRNFYDSYGKYVSDQNKIRDAFLSYLDEEAAFYEKEGNKIGIETDQYIDQCRSARVTLKAVKEKYNSLINTIK